MGFPPTAAGARYADQFLMLAGMAKNKANQLELRIKCDLGELKGVREKMQAIAKSIGFSDDQAAHIVLAVDEALVNVIEHGYGGPCEDAIDITCTKITVDGVEGIDVRIRDYGRQVEPEKIAGRDLDDVRPGGLGVHIMKSVMDDVSYSPAGDKGMVLEMKKFKR